MASYDDETEYFEREDDDSGSYRRNENFDDDDETVLEDFRRKGTPADDFDDSDRTVELKRKKPDILGFIVIKKGKRKNDKYDLTKDDIIIGKNTKCCDLVLDDDDVSKIHCRIRRNIETNEFHFYDCGSTNGSLVNDVETQHVILKSHDKITIGENVEIVFVQV